MSLMKSSQRGHVMPGGDRPLLNVIDIMSPIKPSRRTAWPLANWCILYETQCKDRLGSNSYVQ